MSFPEIDNRSGLAFAPLHVVDEHGNAVLALLSRASLDILADGSLRPASSHMAINPAGELRGAAGESSYRFETDIAFMKMGTDIVLNGHACAPATVTTAMDVGLRVGNASKTVRVFGDRWWSAGVARPKISSPQPFERIELCYENAFGGWDRSDSDPTKHSFEARNPVGTGYCSNAAAVDRRKLPNLEDPSALIDSPRDRPAPACFGFTSPDWLPRARFGGTFDEAWRRDRSPLLPLDFDRRYFSAASPGLTTPSNVIGNERVTVVGATPEGLLAFDLPGMGGVVYALELRNTSPVELCGKLDTIVIDADARRVHLTWRASVAIPRGPQDVMAIAIGPVVGV